MKLAIVGATGNIGQEVVRHLLRRGIPFERLYCVASKKRDLFLDSWRFQVYTMRDLLEDETCKICIFATESTISKTYAPSLLRKKRYVLDASSAFRMDPSVPLLCGSITRDIIHPSVYLYAHANCVASPLALALAPLWGFHPQQVVVSSYQSISGAGWNAMQAHRVATLNVLTEKKTSPEVTIFLPRNSAFNAFPQVGTYHPYGASEEERKIAEETQKLLQTSVPFHVTAVRIPTLQGHGIVVNLFTRETMTLEALAKVYDGVKEVIYEPHTYRTPLEVKSSSGVHIGHVHLQPHHLRLWICSDNLLRGGALDLVETTLTLLEKLREKI